MAVKLIMETGQNIAGMVIMTIRTMYQDFGITPCIFLLKRIEESAPKGADLKSWRY